MVRAEGVEPSRAEARRLLRPVRLPVPPHPHVCPRRAGPGASATVTRHRAASASSASDRAPGAAPHGGSAASRTWLHTRARAASRAGDLLVHVHRPSLLFVMNPCAAAWTARRRRVLGLPAPVAAVGVDEEAVDRGAVGPVRQRRALERLRQPPLHLVDLGDSHWATPSPRLLSEGRGSIARTDAS
jgi:hypothetical protein